MSSVDIGFDLGTVSVIVYLRNKGIILKEPSVVSLDARTNEVKAIGDEAYKMIGRNHKDIAVIRPLCDGVISDIMTAEKMVKYFVRKACQNMIIKPRIIMCVPSEVTGVEADAVVSAALASGARKVYLIEEPIAAAIGAGIDISKPNGFMILDIGGGTTDIAVISLSGIVSKISIRVAGNKLDENIVKYVKNRYDVLIGEKTAELLKTHIGSAIPPEEEEYFEVKGRNLRTGLPQRIRVSATEAFEAMQDHVDQIVSCCQKVLERTPPELVGDIYSNGILMTGGTSQLKNLDKLVAQRIGIKARVAENPVDCVARGTGMAFDMIDNLQEGFKDCSTKLRK